METKGEKGYELTATTYKKDDIHLQNKNSFNTIHPLQENYSLNNNDNKILLPSSIIIGL